MSYDLVIRGGLVVDGSGGAIFPGDVAVTGGRIVAVGDVDGRGSQEVDAEGCVVTPGFIDAHTHMDAQVMWDPIGSSSCWHGVTTVVMGNCGFTLAPARSGRERLVVANLERAEDISAEALAAGIAWSWENFRQYLDVVDRCPKAINYAAQVGHSALRTWAMGERAFEAEATREETALMAAELQDALAAGAIGFTTSRSSAHETSDNRAVASRLAAWDEVLHLADAMANAGGGMFEIATDPGTRDLDPERRKEAWQPLLDLGLRNLVPVTFGVLPMTDGGEEWRETLGILDQVHAAGARMFGQAHPRGVSNIASFRTRLPFDSLPEWADVRSQPLEQQKILLRNPDVRRRLAESARSGRYGRAIGAEARRPDFDRMLVVTSPLPPYRTVAEVAKERGIDPVEAVIDLALEADLDQLFMQAITPGSPEQYLAIMRHPQVVMTFSDAGAHVSQISDASIQTYLLAHWVRDRQDIPLAEAVEMMTGRIARAWGFTGRGLVKSGYLADLNVIDPESVAPQLPVIDTDLPAGAVRLKQKATGIRATIVAGSVTFVDGEHTGALPGRLVRALTARGASSA